jgi:benzodiazapine receptor
MSRKNYWLLIISLGISLSAGFFGSFFTATEAGSWYDLLNKPSFNPPNWLFGPVWTLLFILMGIALFLIWRKGIERKEVQNGLKLFLLQLLFNILWSFCFFYLQNPRLAFLEIIALAIFIIALMMSFYKIDKRASWLLAPYLAWVSFAAFLNYTIWQLN